MQETRACHTLQASRTSDKVYHTHSMSAVARKGVWRVCMCVRVCNVFVSVFTAVTQSMPAMTGLMCLPACKPSSPATAAIWQRTLVADVTHSKNFQLADLVQGVDVGRSDMPRHISIMLSHQPCLITTVTLTGSLLELG